MPAAHLLERVLVGRRQGGGELAPGGVARALLGGVGRGAGHASDEETADLGVGQAGEARAVALAQGAAAAGAAVGDDRHARRAQGVEVAVDGALGALEFGGERGGGHAPARLEQQQQGEQAIGAHGAILPAGRGRIRP